ncbi:MAG: pitrilysin family protein [Firmicutes bacterium]|nr:pitrilysin family protein [Bacillota bacterium]
MPPVRVKLSERIYLNVIETEKFKTNYVSVDFLVPLKKETAALNALLPRVLKRGTISYPDMAALNAALDLLYGSKIMGYVTKYGEIQSFGFYSYPLNNAYALDDTDILDGVIKILKEIIFHPYTENGQFCSAYVESEKRVLIDSIREELNNKNKYAVTRCKQEMCINEAYSIPETGTVEDVEKITAESLTEHFRHIYETADIEIYFIGSADISHITETFKNMFSGLKRAEAQTLHTEVIRRAENGVREIVEEQPVNQGKLSLGFRTDCVLSDKDYTAFSLFREVFGGSTVSKLFMNVREKLSLCYYCSAISEPVKGLLVVTSGIEVSNKQKAQDEILAQLEACKNGEITDEEFDSAKKSLVNGYRQLGDDADSIKHWYFLRMLSGRSDSPEEAAENVMKITAEEVTKAAQKLTLDMVYFLKGTLLSDKGDN